MCVLVVCLFVFLGGAYFEEGTNFMDHAGVAQNSSVSLVLKKKVERRAAVT